MFFARFVHDLCAQSVFTKISASELSRKLTKSALLVGKGAYRCPMYSTSTALLPRTEGWVGETEEAFAPFRSIFSSMKEEEEA